ncbi:DUF7281 domain-containing protein [Flavitalea sp.]|nr:hypothetical protein [Flavitalea sp.]
MNLPLNLAIKIEDMMMEGAAFPASSLKSAVIQRMVEDGVILKIHIGRTQATYRVTDPAAMKAYLLNNFGIRDLSAYIRQFNSETLTRGEAIEISGNSKFRSLRTFHGFLVNCYEPIQCILKNESFIIQPVPGSFIFIYDFRSFLPDSSVTIVGVENPENFRYLAEQQYLFNNIKPLFVSRYPYSSDLIKWLQLIPNKYLHFGDFDFAGLNIYQNEYQRHLGEKASLFVPGEIEMLLQNYGNRELYIKQSRLANNLAQGGNFDHLFMMFHKYKKVLEQEIFIRRKIN